MSNVEVAQPRTTSHVSRLTSHSSNAPILTLRFLSTGESEDEEICPDYLNLLCLPGEETACADAMWEEIGRMDWECVELVDMASDAPLLRAGKVRAFSRGKCPVADLTGGFDAYLGRLSPNSRQQARRLLREGEAAGAKFEIVPADRAASAFDELIKLHQERWTANGKPGVFSAPRFVEFHRNLLKTWLPSGRAMIACLSLAGDPVAVLYGFINGKKFDFYQSGVRMARGTTDPTSPSGLRRAGDRLQTTDQRSNSDTPIPPHFHTSASHAPCHPHLRSPGNLAHLLLMKALAERGVTVYDFLRGSSSYKERLSTGENQLVGIQIWRTTPRVAVHRAGDLARRVARKLRKVTGAISVRELTMSCGLLSLLQA